MAYRDNVDLTPVLMWEGYQNLASLALARILIAGAVVEAQSAVSELERRIANSMTSASFPLEQVRMRACLLAGITLSTPASILGPNSAWSTLHEMSLINLLEQPIGLQSGLPGRTMVTTYRQGAWQEMVFVELDAVPHFVFDPVEEGSRLLSDLQRGMIVRQNVAFSSGAIAAAEELCQMRSCADASGNRAPDALG